MNKLAFVLVLLFASTSQAGEAVVVLLDEKVSSSSPVVTLGQVGKFHGGSETLRAKLAAVDLAERGKLDVPFTITKRQIELRLKLAGYGSDEVLLGGAEQISIVTVKKTLTTDQVIAVAKAALLAKLPHKAEDVQIDLAQPLTVKLPEVPEGTTVDLAAEPHREAKIGRVQMNVTLKQDGGKSYTFPVYFEVKSTHVEPILVKARQRVSMVVRLNAMKVEAIGEAMQDGRRGETIKVQNITSKKIVTGQVTAAGVVDVPLGGSP